MAMNTRKLKLDLISYYPEWSRVKFWRRQRCNEQVPPVRHYYGRGAERLAQCAHCGAPAPELVKSLRKDA